MKLKKHVDVIAFMEAVQRCRENVYFATEDGSRLDLKSTLSQFVFASTVAAKLQELGGEVCCAEEDRPILLPYLEA